MSHQQMTPLSALDAGEQAVVMNLEGGLSVTGRLVALGFTPGAQVSVVRNHKHGALIVNILDTQVVLGRGQADQVYVRRGG